MHNLAPHLPFKASDIHPGVNLATFTHSVQTRANAINFPTSICATPRFQCSWKLSARGSSKGIPNFLLRYLNPSLAMAKDYMKQPCHSIQSTRHHTAPVAQPLPPVLPHFDNIPVYPGPAYGTQPWPNVIADDAGKSIANIFCFGAFADRNSGIVYQDLTGLFPFMSFNGSVCFFVLYHYESCEYIGDLVYHLVPQSWSWYCMTSYSNFLLTYTCLILVLKPQRVFLIRFNLN